MNLSFISNIVQCFMQCKFEMIITSVAVNVFPYVSNAAVRQTWPLHPAARLVHFKTSSYPMHFGLITCPSSGIFYNIKKHSYIVLLVPPVNLNVVISVKYKDP